MVVQLDTAGNCLIVKQYLDRCRNTIRRELMDKLRSSFARDAGIGSALEKNDQSVPVQEVTPSLSVQVES